MNKNNIRNFVSVKKIAEVLTEVLTYVIMKTIDKEDVNLTEILITVGAGMIGWQLLEKTYDIF